MTDKIYLYILTVALIFFQKVSAFKTQIIPDIDNIGATKTSGGWDTLKDILEFFRDSIFGVLAIISVGIFIYIGFMLLKAEWNPDEMKKAFVTLIHVVVGLFIVAASWWIVKMVWAINF